jgi:hypothetical protein
MQQKINIFDFVSDFYEALEISTFTVNNEVLKDLNIIHNKSRDKSEIEKEILTQIMVFLIVEQSKLINPNTKVDLFFDNLNSIIKEINKKFFCLYDHDKVYFLIFKYFMIPFFVKNIKNMELRKIQKLLPTNNANSATRFKNFCKKNENDLFTYDEIQKDGVLDKLLETLRKRSKTDSHSDMNYVFKNFENNHKVLFYFTVSKVIHYFYKKFENKISSNELTKFINRLINDKLKKNSNNSILKLCQNDILKTVHVQLNYETEDFISCFKDFEVEEMLNEIGKRESDCKKFYKITNLDISNINEHDLKLFKNESFYNYECNEISNSDSNKSSTKVKKYLDEFKQNFEKNKSVSGFKKALKLLNRRIKQIE